ncbi:D-3-phosphoglycerate dehydrogenase 2 [Clarireedia jacksonii]
MSTPARDIAGAGAGASGLTRMVSHSLSISPSTTFHSPPSSFSRGPLPRTATNSAAKQLKPFDTQNIKILLLENVNQSGKDILSGQGYQVEALKTSLPEEELIEKIRDVHVIGIRSKTKLNERVLREAKNLIVVGCFCIGTNQVDLEYAARHGIAVFNSPFANSRSVAELAIAEIIVLARQLGDRSTELHNGVWNKVGNKCWEIRGKTLGIIGYSHIGSQLSVLAEAMGMSIIYYDIVNLMALGTTEDQNDELFDNNRSYPCSKDCGLLSACKSINYDIVIIQIFTTKHNRGHNMSFSSILQRSSSNNALNINTPNADRNLTVHGSDWLWAVTAIFALTFLSWLVWTMLLHRPTSGGRHSGTAHTGSKGAHETNGYAREELSRGERIFHYLFTLAAFIGFISYFTMASDLGNTPVRQYIHHGTNTHQTRQVYYVRYIYWFAAWPLILIANLLLSGVSWATILFVVALQEIWVVSWLCGALVSTSYKWGYYVFGVFAYLAVAYFLLHWGLSRSRRFGSANRYPILASVLVGLWLVFPIAWGLSEGLNQLSVTGEMVFYGILDLIAVPVYGSLFLILSQHVDPYLVSFTQRGRQGGTDHRGAYYR